MTATAILCALPSCGIRNRHLDTCPTTTAQTADATGGPGGLGGADSNCRGCLPRPAADGLRLCTLHTDGIVDDATTAAQLHNDLVLQLIRTGQAGEKTSGSSTGAPVPDDDVMAARTLIRATLVRLALLIAEERGFTLPTRWRLVRLPAGVHGPQHRRRVVDGRLTALADYIGRSNTWLAAHPAAAEHAGDLRAIAGNRRLWAMAYPAASDRVFIGLCPATFDDNTVCGARLLARADEPEIECPGCGVRDTVIQWRRWINPHGAELVDAYQAASLLSEHWKTEIKPVTIRVWAARDRIARRGIDGRRTLYSVAELLEYATKQWGEAPRLGPDEAA